MARASLPTARIDRMEEKGTFVPELPEVETIRRIVERELIGRTVTRVEVRLPKLLRGSPIADTQLLVGRRVIAAKRRAKILVVGFSGGLSLLIHFKLSGQLSIHQTSGRRSAAGHPVPDFLGMYPHKTTHAELQFDDGAVLYYSDVRQFGWWRLLPSDEVGAVLEAFAFGPEAVGENTLNGVALGARLRRRSIAIKTALLDQTVVAGLGNIYVDEALHRSKIHPTVAANKLDEGALVRLAEAIPWALERGIEQGGAKIVHHRAYPIDGFPGVHARESQPCPVCGTEVVKVRVGARGTYFCPTCQPVEKA
ncbi:MAG TPA: bifunctional DNA-formamidopyrimidine glycosylase/DNA-(apurinic or apyrimidinic site) lyase [Thermomicrobiales bacterium]|nr:bifunctional DNA-formamidopyrimidine glycosylase/DNA-(apurinic or apyrimidinic site) lyase [Thermomicrobiales bacterium]